MHLAAGCGHLHIVDYLLEQGAAVDGDWENRLHKNSPIYLAIFHRHIGIIKRLLASGALLGLQDINGHTPLHKAVRLADVEIVELLIEAGAPLNLQDRYGCTPLHTAAVEGYVEIVRLLIKAGASLGLEDGDGDVPLDEAVKFGHADIVELLIRAGAPLNTSNKDNCLLQFRLRQLACENPRLGELLRARGMLREGNLWDDDSIVVLEGIDAGVLADYVAHNDDDDDSGNSDEGSLGISHLGSAMQLPLAGAIALFAHQAHRSGK